MDFYDRKTVVSKTKFYQLRGKVSNFSLIIESKPVSFLRRILIYLKKNCKFASRQQLNRLKLSPERLNRLGLYRR